MGVVPAWEGLEGGRGSSVGVVRGWAWLEGGWG